MLKLYIYIYYLLQTADKLSNLWLSFLLTFTLTYMFVKNDFPRYTLSVKVSFFLALAGVLFIPDKNTLAYLLFEGML